ncbi:MAG: bifunctional adenosylcobinamide kinase/adenosylcobinamide-phosphate guanylyltransferase [Firmicutes bacterium]|nr:bifunctional adenosylcobinamide kinase/adenosylcobinamide-phosphate guanylyltransferase [Bacillota bacterium]
MFILITGGSGSGKSEFAEKTAAELGGDMLYVATMKPYDEECVKRIERHRKMRSGKGFRTAECYESLSSLEERADTMLLECVSNLTANLMFSDKKETDPHKISADVLSLKCKSLVAVTNEISSDGINYDGDTKEYIRILGEINSLLAKKADRVYEVVYGIPVRIK